MTASGLPGADGLEESDLSPAKGVVGSDLGPRKGGKGVPSFQSPVAATRRTEKAQGGAERNPGSPHPMTPRPNGANGDHTHPVPCALSGHRGRCVAWSPGFHPVLAFTGCPFGARGPMRPLGIHPAPAPAATRRTATAQRWSEAEPWVTPTPMTPRPNGANGDHMHPVPCALSGLVFISGPCSQGDAPGCLGSPRWGWMRHRQARPIRDSVAPPGLMPQSAETQRSRAGLPSAGAPHLDTGMDRALHFASPD